MIVCSSSPALIFLSTQLTVNCPGWSPHQSAVIRTPRYWLPSRDSYQLYSHMHVTTLLAHLDCASDHLHSTHTPFLKQSHFCSWLRTNNYMNTSAVILNNKVTVKRNFTLCISQGLVFMFRLKKSIPDWFLCIYRYCQRINWWIFESGGISSEALSEQNSNLLWFFTLWSKLINFDISS